MEILISLLTLVVMEIVLGIDNVVFISILVGKLEPTQARRARQIGLALALIFRILLLSVITWLIGFNKTLFTLGGVDVSGKALILFAGGLFLIYKSTVEIHEKVDGDEDSTPKLKKMSMMKAIFQIILLDIVFSFDSILTAIGMVQDNLAIMVAAVVISMIVMFFFSAMVSRFIERHPSVKILALSFLLMIGLMLIAEGAGFHVPKGYVYFAMGFSIFVELLNLRSRKHKKKIQN